MRLIRIAASGCFETCGCMRYSGSHWGFFCYLLLFWCKNLLLICSHGAQKWLTGPADEGHSQLTKSYHLSTSPSLSLTCVKAIWEEARLLFLTLDASSFSESIKSSSVRESNFLLCHGAQRSVIPKLCLASERGKAGARVRVRASGEQEHLFLLLGSCLVAGRWTDGSFSVAVKGVHRKEMQLMRVPFSSFLCGSHPHPRWVRLLWKYISCHTAL